LRAFLQASPEIRRELVTADVFQLAQDTVNFESKKFVEAKRLSEIPCLLPQAVRWVVDGDVDFRFPTETYDDVPLLIIDVHHELVKGLKEICLPEHIFELIEDYNEYSFTKTEPTK
jgi:hypothetical protein